MFDFSGKVVALTGASSGIGLETARKFYMAGASLALCSRSEERVRKACAEWAADETRILFCSCDTSKVSDIMAFRDAAAGRFGQIDIWVNNAGIEHPCPAEELTEEWYDRVVDTNMKGYFFGCQAAAQDMLKRNKGVIVNVGSVNAVTVVPGQAVYAATKAAIMHMTKLFASEWARRGIRVNCAGPGSIPTGINDAKYKVPGAHEAMCRKIPMGRRGETGEVADLILYLASDEASYVTGQMIYVDGGLELVHG